MYLALAQSSQQGVSLGTALFLLGILGLIFALRRTLVRSRRLRMDTGDDKIEEERARRRTIDRIEMLNHHRKQRKAVKFDRNARVMTPEQRDYLMQIDKWQSEHRSGGSDG